MLGRRFGARPREIRWLLDRLAPAYLVDFERGADELLTWILALAGPWEIGVSLRQGVSFLSLHGAWTRDGLGFVLVWKETIHLQVQLVCVFLEQSVWSIR